MTKEELLINGLKYYCVNPQERRCIDEKGNCRYSPYSLGKEETSEGCWIGRLLDPEVAKKIDYNEQDVDIVSLIEENYYELPNYMNNVNMDYLNKLQDLHDADAYWTQSGLSELGKEKVTIICNQNNIPLEKVKQWLN